MSTGSKEEDRDIGELKSLLNQEKGHFIWKKQLLNFVALVANIIMNVFRKIVFSKCTSADWVTLGAFLILMCVIVITSVKNVSRE